MHEPAIEWFAASGKDRESKRGKRKEERGKNGKRLSFTLSPVGSPLASPTNKFMGCSFWWLPRINPWVAWGVAHGRPTDESMEFERARNSPDT